MSRRAQKRNTLFPAIENIINELANAPIQNPVQKSNGNTRPKANIISKDDHYAIELALPGFKKEDIEITLNKDELIVASKEIQPEETNYTLREYDYSNFTRRFLLPDNIEKNKIDASFLNGILSISLFIAEEAKPKEIEIK